MMSQNTSLKIPTTWFINSVVTVSIGSSPPQNKCYLITNPNFTMLKRLTPPFRAGFVSSVHLWHLILCNGKKNKCIIYCVCCVIGLHVNVVNTLSFQHGHKTQQRGHVSVRDYVHDESRMLFKCFPEPNTHTRNHSLLKVLCVISTFWCITVKAESLKDTKCWSISVK